MEKKCFAQITRLRQDWTQSLMSPHLGPLVLSIARSSHIQDASSEVWALVRQEPVYLFALCSEKPALPSRSSCPRSAS